MKRYLIYGGILMLIAAACNPSKQMQLNSTERQAQRGYHANQAEKIIDENAKNRKKNQASSEKNRQEANKQAAQKKSASTGTNTGSFNFY